MSPAFFITRCIANAIAFWAVNKHPYNFYVLARWPDFLVCCLGFWRSRHRMWPSFAPPYTVVGMLFNPLIPFHFQRATWQVIDVTPNVILLASLGGPEQTHPLPVRLR